MFRRADGGGGERVKKTPTLGSEYRSGPAVRSILYKKAERGTDKDTKGGVLSG